MRYDLVSSSRRQHVTVCEYDYGIRGRGEVETFASLSPQVFDTILHVYLLLQVIDFEFIRRVLCFETLLTVLFCYPYSAFSAPALFLSSLAIIMFTFFSDSN